LTKNSDTKNWKQFQNTASVILSTNATATAFKTD
jgi:hypothetical protein